MRFTIGAAVLALALAGVQPEPRITGVAPETPVVSPKPQALTVSGEGFKTGLTLFVTTPGGAVKTFAGADIAAQRATSFQVSFALDAVGRYSLVVANEDGMRSTAYAIQARAATRQPWIDEVTPAEFSRSREPQIVTLTGRNFATGLKVSLTDPAGTVTNPAVDRVEANTVVLKVVFDQAGPHEILVTNSSGESSNAVALTVNW